MFYRIILILYISLIYSNVLAKNSRILIASTTSTYDTGLLDYLNNEFNKKFDIDIHVLVLGTGQAIKVAENGDVDILLVHHYNAEKKFVNEGYGIKRHDLMFNDYVIVGPKFDKNNCKSIEATLLRIKNNNLVFISRGEDPP